MKWILVLAAAVVHAQWEPTFMQTPATGAPRLISEISAPDGSLFGAYNVRYDVARQLVFSITAFSNSIAAINVSDPTAPYIQGAVIGTEQVPPTNQTGPVDNQLVGMTMDYVGHRMFIAAFFLEAVVIFDTSDPANMAELNFIEDPVLLDHPAGMEYDGVRDLVIVTGRNSNGIIIIDVSDRLSSTIVGSVLDNETLAGAHSVAYDPDTYLAYVGAYLVDGMTIVDCSDATNPVVLGHIRDSTYNDWPVQLIIDQPNLLVYVAGAASGSLAVFNVSDTSNPTLAGGLKDERLMSIAGMAYEKKTRRIVGATVIANTVATISVLDPVNPVLLGSVAYYNGSRDVAFDEDRELAYLCSQWAAPEFAIFDMSDPEVGGSGETPCATTADCVIPGHTCKCGAQTSRRLDNINNHGRRGGGGSNNRNSRGLLFGAYESSCVCGW